VELADLEGVLQDAAAAAAAGANLAIRAAAAGTLAADQVGRRRGIWDKEGGGHVLHGEVRQSHDFSRYSVSKSAL
jgi:hypothetical protein